MREITQQAYEDLRSYIQSSWQYIELQDQSSTPIIRLSPSDSRVTSVIDGNNVKITIIVNGTDPSLINKTFAKSAIYKVATGGDKLSEESFSQFTIESDQDELTVIHTIQVPQVI